MKQCIKISTYIDDEQSWELSDNENSYRFTAKNRNENYKWKSYIENALMPKFDKTDGKSISNLIEFKLNLNHILNLKLYLIKMNT